MSTNVTAPALPFDPIARAAQTWAERIGPSTSMSAVTNIMRVQQILQATVDERLKPHGLSFARYEALVLLSFSQRGSLPMRMMGERLQLHPTSITNIVDRLEADGLARRLPHPSDRRTTLVELTDAGRERLTGGHRSGHHRRLRVRRAGRPRTGAALRAADQGPAGGRRLRLSPSRGRRPGQAASQRNNRVAMKVTTAAKASRISDRQQRRRGPSPRTITSFMPSTR